jgi:hypothetical protein
VQGSVKKNGKKWSQSTDSVEALNRKETKEGIQKTVEFESITSQSGPSRTHIPSQTPTKEEPFPKRVGFIDLEAWLKTTMQVVSFILMSASLIVFCEPSFLPSGSFLDVNLLGWFRSMWQG